MTTTVVLSFDGADAIGQLPCSECASLILVRFPIATGRIRMLAAAAGVAGTLRLNFPGAYVCTRCAELLELEVQ